jgi:hypothetical protein
MNELAQQLAAHFNRTPVEKPSTQTSKSGSKHNRPKHSRKIAKVEKAQEVPAPAPMAIGAVAAPANEPLVKNRKKIWFHVGVEVRRPKRLRLIEHSAHVGEPYKASRIGITDSGYVNTFFYNLADDVEQGVPLVTKATLWEKELIDGRKFFYLDFDVLADNVQPNSRIFIVGGEDFHKSPAVIKHNYLPNANFIVVLKKIS